MLQTRRNVWKCTKNASPVWFKIVREGLEGGARDFYITGDFNVELGLMCTVENDEEELTKLYGPLCWQLYHKDPGGFKKIMWYGIMKEFGCQLSFTWSVCGKVS